MTTPEYLRPFVLPTEPATVIDGGGFDLYLSSNRAGPTPVTVLVHGGPMREPPVAPATHWPVFRGYAAALAARGIAAAMFDHVLLRSMDYAKAAEQLAAVVDAARAHAAVDGDRVAIWFFSGGGPLAAWALRKPPQWLRAVALSYPMLQPLGQVSGFAPALELSAATRLPILLTRVGLEFPDFAAAQDDFVNAAQSQRADLTVIEIPDGHHAFDVVDNTDHCRQAIADALAFLHGRLI